MIDPYDRRAVIELLRNAAEYVRYGSRPLKDITFGYDPMTIHDGLTDLANHLEMED